MKNLLLLFTAAIVLFSCSSQDEVLNQNEVIEKEDLMLTEENTEEIKLRIASPDIPTFAPSNLHMIYEYVSIENGKYYDFYYTKTKRSGNSFVDPISGRTYIYQRELGKICKTLIPYRGLISTIAKCRLVYSPSAKLYSFVIYRADSSASEYETGVIAEELGYMVLSIHPDDHHNFADGYWGVLTAYRSRTDEYRTKTIRFYDSAEMENWDADPEWYLKWSFYGEIGIIVK